MIKVNHQDMLNKANASVASVGDTVKTDRFRQKYHFMAPAYWINDPNGLIRFKGKYHMFYQFNPYAPVWGAMHWGHAVSGDLVNWEHLPIALAPSETYDNHERGGCFSGSAVDDNGVLSLIYTATTNYGEGFVQTQCLATSTDGLNFIKYEGNPVIKEHPEVGSADFRDPKVWKHEGSWYMVVGSCKDGKGKALLYKSPDLRYWEYMSVLAESDGTIGTMWECPDFYPMGDRYVLMFSPMGMGCKKTIYLIGDMDYTTGKFTWDVMGEVDIGFDYYAPQSFLDDSGRRILIAWANAWDWMPWWKDFGPTHTGNWCGAMSTPREAKVCKDGRLSFVPVKELEVLRDKKYSFKNLKIVPNESFLNRQIVGTALEILAELKLKDCPADKFGFKLRCSEDNKEETLVEYNVKTGELCFDRSKSDFTSSGVCTCKVESANSDVLKLHIFMDTSSVEVFTDDYRVAVSCNIYPDEGSTGMDLYCIGAETEVLSLEVWNLKSAI